MMRERWLLENTARLDGKTVAITGATGGLGTELCRSLAELGAALILMDRNQDRSRALRERLEAEFPGVQISHIPVDLSDMQTVRRATEELKRAAPDVLIHNAGAYKIPRYRCDTGYDNIFQINFVSPYYMTRELLPVMRERRGRVVAVGSIAHNYSHIDPSDVDFFGRSACSKVYGNAKRYLMFSLHELFAHEQTASLSVVHPGITFTNITNHYPPLLFALIKHPMKVIFMKPRTACLSLLQGVFEPCEYHTWIGPRFFDVWGTPVKRAMRTCSVDESREIARIAERILGDLKKVQTGKKDNGKDQSI